MAPSLPLINSNKQLPKQLLEHNNLFHVVETGLKDEPDTTGKSIQS